MHEYSIPLAQNILRTQLFLAYIAAAAPFGMSVVCVKTGSLKFQTTNSPALQAHLTLLAAPWSVLLLCEHASCIHRGSFPGSPLLSSTHQHRLLGGHPWPESCGNLGVFIIQRPCSLCCFRKGQAKVCVFGSARCQADTVSLTALKTPTVDILPPIICSIPGSHTPARSWIAVCVCVCMFLCAVEHVSLLGICTECMRF